MSEKSQGSQSSFARRRGAKPLADLIGGVMAPACRKRGFATADLLAQWPDIVGERYGETTQPEALHWPRRQDGGSGIPEPATLVVRCDGPSALFLQHELPQVMQRINTFFGWAAVGRIKIVQKPLKHLPQRATPTLRALDEAEEAELKGRLDAVDEAPLRAALDRLGRAIIARRRK
ncbi:hypothetical protein C8N35_101272 [Breoghania corrubedonensis]|uniref:DUF721 domain-containing protein n=1 Tax=Breoghania corrubedonensis TaxID=665038 RepID=A0A2T5VEQ2_9HYPH|nr:DciA family protein [Breoghania corrubedonensis]PTW62234.1 hypothetical protein C8N35_101272 [Breoghania corrubedonensis]